MVLRYSDLLKTGLAGEAFLMTYAPLGVWKTNDDDDDCVLVIVFIIKHLFGELPFDVF